MKGPFNPVEMIRSKRDGHGHSAAEIRDFIDQFGEPRSSERRQRMSDELKKVRERR